MNWQLLESSSFSKQCLSQALYSTNQLIIQLSISTNNDWQAGGWIWAEYQIEGLPITKSESKRISLHIPLLFEVPPILGNYPFKIGCELRPWISSANISIFSFSL